MQLLSSFVLQLQFFIKIILLLLLSIILFFIYFISILISYQNLLNLKISINNKLYPAKKIIDLDYQIEEKQNRERLNINIGIDKKSINKDIQDKTSVYLKHKFEKRGITQAPILNINSKFPFGIINTFTSVSFQESLQFFLNQLNLLMKFLMNYTNLTLMRVLIMNLIK